MWITGVGKELRRRREVSGATLEALGRRVGLSANYIGNVENGQRDFSLSTLLTLAMGLKAEPGELLADLKGPSAASLEAVRLLELVPPRVRVALIHILRSCSER